MSVFFQSSIAVSLIAMVTIRMLCVVASESSPLNYEAQIIEGQQIEDFHCGICHKFLEPGQISCTPSCKHSFCTPCIEQWIKINPTCPMCRGDFPESGEISDVFRQKLEPIKAFCPYKSASSDTFGECRWKGSILSLKNHTESECLFSRLRCPNNCSPLRGDDAASSSRNRRNLVPELYSGAELPGHRAICPLEQVQCSNRCSNALFSRKYLPVHRSACLLERVQCPSKCSDAFFTARDLLHHQKYSCMKRMEKCLLCSQEIEKYNMRKHLEGCARVHPQPSSSLNRDLPEVMIRLLKVFNKAKLYDMIADMLLHSSSSKQIIMTDRHGQSALSYAIANGNSDMVRLLLELNPSESHMWTVRFSTLFSAPLQAVKLFLDVWCSSTERLLRSHGRGTLLMEMVLFAPVSTTKLLLDCDSSEQHLLKRNYQGRTALMFACEEERTDSVQLLLEFNSSEDHLLVSDLDGYTPLMRASENGHTEVAALLLKSSSSERHLLAIDLAGRTALVLACRHGNIAIVELLLKASSSDTHLLAADHYGATALMEAIVMTNEPLVELLLSFNSNQGHLLAEDEHGRTAESLAAMSGNVAIVKLLKKAAKPHRHPFRALFGAWNPLKRRTN